VLAFLPIKVPGNPLGDLWRSIRPDEVLAGIAFASETGVREFRKSVVGRDAFDAAHKKWLIGIQRGVTQPRALQRLADIESSEVKVPFGHAALAEAGLNASTSFHPKLVYLENSVTGEVAVASMSANLTLSGLTSNVEQILAWRGTKSDDVAAAFRGWWDPLWAAADRVDEAFLAEYETKRPKIPPPPNTTTEEPRGSELRAAGSFWVELTRKPEGESYNQIELLLNGHHFFYPDTPSPSKVADRPLAFEDTRGNLYETGGRKVTFHGSEKGNGMWRVYLPTLAEGFRGYQDGDVLVRFTRTAVKDRYRLEVTPVGSPQALRWSAESTAVEKPGSPPRRIGWA
jgi:hypothetical protein